MTILVSATLKNLDKNNIFEKREKVELLKNGTNNIWVVIDLKMLIRSLIRFSTHAMMSCRLPDRMIKKQSQSGRPLAVEQPNILDIGRKK